MTDRAALAETLVQRLIDIGALDCKREQSIKEVARVLAQEEPSSPPTEQPPGDRFLLNAYGRQCFDLGVKAGAASNRADKLAEQLDAAEARLRQCEQERDELLRANHKWLIDYGMYCKSAVTKIEALEAAHGRLRTALRAFLSHYERFGFHPSDGWLMEAVDDLWAALTPSPEEPTP